MFQLNRKNIIILSIIWVLFLGLIFCNWYLKNSNSKLEDNTNDKEDIIKPDYIGLDYYSFYDENNLKVESVNEKKINFLKISGLKDKNVEKIVNDKLKKSAEEFNSKYRCEGFQNTTLNAFNIFSAENRCYNSKDKKTYIEGVNYNLNNGEDILFKDLFSSTANLSNIVYTGVYYEVNTEVEFSILGFNKELVSTKIYEEEGVETQYYSGRTTKEIKKDIDEFEKAKDNIEEYIYKATKKILSLDEIKFSLNNNGVRILNDTEVIKNKLSIRPMIRAKENSYHFAFYSKYVSKESLFDDSYEGNKHLFLSGEQNVNLDYVMIKAIDNYAFLDLECTYCEMNKKVKDFFNEFVENQIKILDKSKFTYFNITPNSYIFEDGKSYNVYISYSKCEMSKDYFDKEYIYKLFDAKNSQDDFEENPYYGQTWEKEYKTDNFSCINDSIQERIYS